MDYKITKWETHGAFDKLQVEYRRDLGSGGDQARAGITIKPYDMGCMIDCVRGTEHYILDWDRQTEGDSFTIRIAGEEERKGILRLFKCLIKEMEADMGVYPNIKKSRGL